MCHQKLSFIPFWLFTAFALSLTTSNGLAADQTTVSREPAGGATPFRLPDRITTLDGRTYEKVILDKVEPDALVVLFSPVKGGSGAAKLKFRNLPAELRERYGYDPTKASDYEAAQARGEAVWLAEAALWEQQRQAAQAEQMTWERQMRAEAETRRTQAEQARAETARYAQEQPAYYYTGGYYTPCHYNEGRRFNHHVSRQLPAVDLTISPVSPYIAPMRPLGK